MEERLRQLFDYQRFEANAKLSKVIAQAEAFHAVCRLSDDELTLVCAAGEADTGGPGDRGTEADGGQGKAISRRK